MNFKKLVHLKCAAVMASSKAMVIKVMKLGLQQAFRMIIEFICYKSVKCRRWGRKGTCPPKFGKYFWGNHVKFWHFSGKYRKISKFGNFVCPGKYHVKFGHFVNFSDIFGQKCFALSQS